MKFLLPLLLLRPLPAQIIGVVAAGNGVIPSYQNNLLGVSLLVSTVRYSWTITQYESSPGQYTKSFYFAATQCLYTNDVPALPGIVFGIPLLQPTCTPLSPDQAELLAPIQEAMEMYPTLAPTIHHNPPEPLPPLIAAVPPATQADYVMLLYDALNNNMMSVDMTTFAQVTVPVQTVNIFAQRPTATGPENEVWTAYGPITESGGTVFANAGITIVDMGTAKVLATLPDTTEAQPVKIAFTNDGSAVIEAVALPTPDSAGNHGALRIFDAATQTMTSSFPLPYAPTAMMLAPDNLTVYIVSSPKSFTQTLTYYDVLSGTADLTVNLPTSIPVTALPSVFLHPDGARLFCALCSTTGLTVMDLNTQQVTVIPFNPSTSAVFGDSAQLSQDGNTMTIWNSLGSVWSIDTRTGAVMAAYQVGGHSTVMGGPAQ